MCMAFLRGRISAQTAASAVVVLALAAGMGLGSGRTLAQVHLTKHNLSSVPVAPNSRASSMTEICVFCHTPFGADASAAKPLWNRNPEGGGTYPTYNSLGTSRLDGVTAPVGSVSIACLSCHDGSQALNLMINMPGTIRGGSLPIAGAASQGDHPVGMQYAGGPSVAGGGPPVAPSVYSHTAMKDEDFNDVQSALLNGQTVWWVDTASGTAGAREKSDLQLYTRVVTPLPEFNARDPLEREEPFVECASCHDPHSAVNGTFLRISNVGGAVCLACHNKK
jgi:predicted CXXCH cytochrome family protein